MDVNGVAAVILMADDDTDDQVLVQEALAEAEANVELRCVDDGEALMNYLHQSGAFSDPTTAPRPSLILLDLNMPKVDGREALKKIRSDADLHMIPVVVLSTSKAPEDVRHSYDLGASAFISKPVTFDELIDVMRVLTSYWFKVVTPAPVHSGG